MNKTEHAPPPVRVSGNAYKVLSDCIRKWSGWRDATLVLGPTDERISPFATTNDETHVVTLNIDRLLLNPNRVLNTVTPFRLRQEAVVTGVAIHECGHARRSKWGKVRMHSDGTPVTRATQAFAILLEEARIEGLMFRDADKIGARGLGWTMRASNAALREPTRLAKDPNQRVMDLITAWVLRAGKQTALFKRSYVDGVPAYNLPQWVGDFHSLLAQGIDDHLEEIDPDGSFRADRIRVVNLLMDMLVIDDDTGPTMLDYARDVLDILFPETDEDDRPEPQAGCALPMPPQSGDPDEGDQEQAEEAGGSPESDEQEAEDPEEGDDADGAGEGDEEDGEPEDEAVSDGSDTEPDEDSTEDDELQDLLNGIESEAETSEAESSAGAGGGEPSMIDADKPGYRHPTSEEREIGKGAEKFLRAVIAPTEQSRTYLSSSVSSQIDGRALTEWKAGGQVREPQFFKQTRRTVEPAPPIEIAILVDWSSSMDIMQTPSAVLAWALASAALDLQNFAGRGQQIQSTLIHWGRTVQVTQAVGEQMPGIYEPSCDEGTSALNRALREVENQIPGFFDASEKPRNRLLVNFTDYELFRSGLSEIQRYMQRGIGSGMNLISIVPRGWSEHAPYCDYRKCMSTVAERRGMVEVMKYNPDAPAQVWDHAARLLNR